jgi:DNA-binding response OmpR family regulator
MMASMRFERRRARPSTPVVLIVDDDDTVADAIAEALDAAGYRAVHARDGWQALDALKREHPAVLLVDLFMPGMSGTEFLRFVKANAGWSRIPRVIMTGTNDPMIGIREDAAVFYKPLDLDSLVAVVRRYSGHRSRPQVSAVERAG